MKILSFMEAQKRLHAFFCRLGKRSLLVSLFILFLIGIIAFMGPESTIKSSYFASRIISIIGSVTAILYFMFILSLFYCIHHWGIAAKLAAFISLIASIGIGFIAEVAMFRMYHDLSGYMPHSNTLYMLSGIIIGFFSIQYWIYMTFSGHWESSTS
ncbi:MAG: hypothetical protein Q9P90_15675 [candidate division KSB1 bacterium]|nr:hypothetical protein [candidate division KSB1 bacterium]